VLPPWNSLSPQRIAQRIARVEATWQAAGTASAPEAAVTAATLFARAGLVPDAWQTQVCTTPGNQLVLCHRQSGKSTTFAALGLEMACQKAEAVVLLLSPSLRQSGELFRKVKTFYHATQPLPLLQDSALSLELANGSRIVSLPGTADTIVGFSSVDLLILDEAARIPDGTYYAIRPMLAMSHGRLLAATTPYGQRGWFWEAWEGREEDEDATLDQLTVEAILADLGIAWSTEAAWTEDSWPVAWTRTKLTAPENPRLDKRYLANERRQVPELVFQQEWLCRFVEVMEAVFRYEDLQGMLDPDIVPLFTGQHHQIAATLTEPLRGASASVKPLTFREDS
jgi:hypothetical protein